MPARKVDKRELLESMQYTNQRAVLDKSYSYAMIDAVLQYRIAIPYRDNAGGHARATRVDAIHKSTCCVRQIIQLCDDQCSIAIPYRDTVSR